MLAQILSFTDMVVVKVTPILNEIVAAFLIVFIGLIIGKILGNITLRFFRDVDRTSLLRKKYRLANNLSTIVSYSIYTIAVILALNSLNALWLVIVFIALCFTVVLGFSVLFTVRDFIPNFFARTKVIKKYDIGKTYSIKRVRGVLENVGVLEIRLRKDNGDIIIIPHKEVIN